MPLKREEDKEFIDLKVIQTAEAKKSGRILVQTNGTQKEVFVPRRKSFGILVKPQKEGKISSRALRCISREFSTSNNNVNRSPSVTNLTLVRRKSCSLGSIDKAAVFEAERRFSRSSMRRSRSRGSSIHGSRDSSRSRSRHRNSSVSSRGSANSSGEREIQNRYRNKENCADTLQRNSFSGQFGDRHIRFGMDGEQEDSEESQYEMVQSITPQQTHQPSVRHHNLNYTTPVFSSNNSNNSPLVQNIDEPKGYHIDHKQWAKMNSQTGEVPLNDEIEAYRRKFSNFYSSSSDEGTAIDEQPWVEPKTSPPPVYRAEMENQNYRRQQFIPYHNESFNSESTYSNLDSRHPSLPPRTAPKRPPKAFNENLNKKLIASPNQRPIETGPKLPPKPIATKHDQSPHGNQKHHQMIQYNARQNNSEIQRTDPPIFRKNNENMKPISIHGYIKSDGSVENETAATPMLKKSRSKVVLDDESLGDYDSRENLSNDRSRGKVECYSGILHLLNITFAVLTVATMAIVSSNWDHSPADACPLFVQTNLQHTRYWGNKNKVPCYITAYIPVLVISISLILIFIHGVMLFFWRNDKKVSPLYVSNSFGITLLFLNLVSFITAFVVAVTLTDGLRQTCLSFKLISDMEYRPSSCQNGLDGLDLNYDLDGTFYLLIFGIIGAWMSVVFTLTLTVIYTVRVGWCRCCALQ